MSKIYQRVELTANILIIVLALLVGGTIVYKYFLYPPAAANRPARLQPTIGSKINLPDVSLSGKSKALVLVLQKGCRFCTESATFYERLVREVQNKDTKLVAVLPSSKEESAAYLHGFGITNLEIKQVSLNDLQVSGTPTLILINEKAEILNFWVGKLTPDKEDEVIAQLK